MPAYVREICDVAVALAFMAQAAGRLEGAVVRDRLTAMGRADRLVAHGEIGCR